MTKRSNFLYWLNVGGDLLYLLIVGGLYISGRSLFHGQMMLLAQVASGILIVSLPRLMERWWHFRFPPVLIYLFEIFILLSVLLGTGLQCYSVPYWDKFEHLFSAAMLAGLGFAIFAALTLQKRLTSTSPLLMALFALAFGTTIGVLWEFYEFTFDGLLGLNMQRYMATGGELLRGRAALMDTMGDLFMDFFGSLGLALFGYFGIKRDLRWLDTFAFQPDHKSVNH